jgi:predicted MFS family arabinose efflux permease
VPNHKSGNFTIALTTPTPSQPPRIGEAQLYIYSMSCAVAVASGYYIHPLIARVGESFGVSGFLLGLVPGLNQIGIALGILLLLPLGDKINNRTLVSLCLAGQCAGLFALATLTNYPAFLFASFMLGFLTITPYLLPTYVTKRVRPERLGHVTGIITAGLTVGILAARAGGGVVGHYFGWRATYVVGGTLVLILLLTLRATMKEPGEASSEKPEPVGYFSLLRSLLPLLTKTPGLIRAALIQALGFGAFIALWLGVGLHLTSPAMGYGVDTVGYLSLVAIVNAYISPVAGRWIDRSGPAHARKILSLIKFSGAAILPIAGENLWILVVALLLFNGPGAAIDIANRTILFRLRPEIRTRLITNYVVIMFIGGGLASWLATIAFSAFGWIGISLLVITMCLLIIALAWTAREALQSG